MTALRALSAGSAAALFALAGLAGLARAGTETAAQLGPAAATGAEAHAGIAARAKRLHLAMGCGNEFAFSQGFFLSLHYGPGHDVDKRNLASWPVTLLLAKARLLLDDDGEPACTAKLTGDIIREWKGITVRNAPLENETKSALVNRVYKELYDSIPGVSGPACADVARVRDDMDVDLVVSHACLARQIRAVMTNPRHGPWTEEGRKVTPLMPGTSSDKLLCLSELSGKVEGVKGDWDMAVTDFTRLASMLGHHVGPGGMVGEDIDAAIATLNRRFLTLRSSPEQGATAREVFNLVTSCGNLPNQFGDAADTVNGTGVDTKMDHYSSAAREALREKSFWDSVLRFLAALLVVLAIAVAAVLAGAIAGIVAGALAGGVAAGAAIAVAVVAVVFISAVGGGIEETENHLLMQNSARYLKNKMMMEELRRQEDREGFDTIAALNEEVRIWLLERMQRIVREDFVEYNSKPYNRFSHAAILNLFDYACDIMWDYGGSDTPCGGKDIAIKTAAAAVLDLSSAKLAVGSMEGRRSIPYRRLAEQNHRFYDGGVSMLDLVAGADNQLAALQVWTGQMRHAPGGEARPATFGQLVPWSTSTYRPAAMILDMAVNKAVPREQQYRHHTRERYASGNGWLITAGGTDERPAQGFRTPLGFTIYPEIRGDVTNDRGVGVPTMLMTAAQIARPDGQLEGRATVRQFLRFDGKDEDWGLLDNKPMRSYSLNHCVAGSFACGRRMQLPSDFDPVACLTRMVAANFHIVDSTRCPSFRDGDANAANDLFIAIFHSPQGWGFFEVAQQDAFGRSADAYAAAIRERNGGRLAGWSTAGRGDTVEYFAVTQNRLLAFTPEDEDFGAGRRACGVVNHESGARFTISDVSAAQAGDCRSAPQRIFIDLDDARKPIRRAEGGLPLDPLPN